MFGLGPEKLFVLLAAALFVLGPERLPAAVTWVGRAVGQTRTLLATAGRQLRDEVGPELDQIQEPLRQLGEPLGRLRALRTPQTAVLSHLLAEPGPEPGPSAQAPPGSAK